MNDDVEGGKRVLNKPGNAIPIFRINGDNSPTADIILEPV